MDNEPLTLNDVYTMLGERDIMIFRQNQQFDGISQQLAEANQTIASQQETIAALQKQVAAFSAPNQ